MKKKQASKKKPPQKSKIRKFEDTKGVDPQIEEGQTKQWPKEKGQKDNLQNIAHKAKNRVTLL